MPTISQCIENNIRLRAAKAEATTKRQAAIEAQKSFSARIYNSIRKFLLVRL